MPTWRECALSHQRRKGFCKLTSHLAIKFLPSFEILYGILVDLSQVAFSIPCVKLIRFCYRGVSPPTHPFFLNRKENVQGF